MGMEKLTQLEVISLINNPNLTKAQIAELQKALPNRDIFQHHEVKTPRDTPVCIPTAL